MEGTYFYFMDIYTNFFTYKVHIVYLQNIKGKQVIFLKYVGTYSFNQENLIFGSRKGTEEGHIKNPYLLNEAEKQTVVTRSLAQPIQCQALSQALDNQKIHRAVQSLTQGAYSLPRKVEINKI